MQTCGAYGKYAARHYHLDGRTFQIFLEKTIITEHSRRTLDGLLNAQNAATLAPQRAGSAARGIFLPLLVIPPIQRGRTA